MEKYDKIHLGSELELISPPMEATILSWVCGELQSLLPGIEVKIVLEATAREISFKKINLAPRHPYSGYQETDWTSNSFRPSGGGMVFDLVQRKLLELNDEISRNRDKI